MGGSLFLLEGAVMRREVTLLLLALVCWVVVGRAQEEGTTAVYDEPVSASTIPSPTQPIQQPRSQVDLSSTSFKTETRKSEKKEINYNKPPSTSEGSNVVYRLVSEEGSTCILLRVDAIIEFQYTTKLNQEQKSDMFVPNSATVDGDCSGEDEQTLILKWKSFVLLWYFSKTPGGERWYVDRIELKYDSTDRTFEHIKDRGRSYVLTKRTTHNQLLFSTPVGQSYWCDREIDLELTNKKQTDTIAKMLLRDLTVEPFLFKNDEFGPGYKCSAIGAGSFRSETAPLIVGSTLAATCLLTVVGYAVFRYFKIKKVQYDTME